MPRVPFDPKTDYYHLLGVEPDAPSETIQAAYRRLAKAFHPDLNSGSSAAERMARLNVAKSVLLDPQTRAVYDQVRIPRAARMERERVAAATSVRNVGNFSVRYVPYQPSRPRYRVVSTTSARAMPRSGFDRGTGILLLIAVPLIALLSLYVFQAVQLSIEPLKAASTDATLAPGQNAHTTSRGAADGVFQMIRAQPPSRDLALRANNFILARSDSTPESEELRADGRRLLRSASSGDAEAWDDAVGHICQLAGRC
ncbi:MAG: J domain-containing protein [Chloroflexi bacterium]|nr:J domain-containing protein [Chloroflexota bacterium]MBV9602158.1 J domain-containing protein [Chloroflexota bacterium]